jgi:MarR family transcriptional regulator, lower aerobic nicotinate degradation pathway regulator
MSKPASTPVKAKPRAARAALPPVDLGQLPGHYIRRLQQIAVAIFLQETSAQGVTPVQFAALQTVASNPGIDQRTLAGMIGFDTSTIAGVIDRLETRGLMLRNPSPDDRRVRLLRLSDEGAAVLEEMLPAVLHAQRRMLDPLDTHDQREFMRMLQILVSANNELSRAPSETD